MIIKSGDEERMEENIGEGDGKVTSDLDLDRNEMKAQDCVAWRGFVNVHWGIESREEHLLYFQ